MSVCTCMRVYYVPDACEKCFPVLKICDCMISGPVVIRKQHTRNTVSAA